jgi:hypothetical protein
LQKNQTIKNNKYLKSSFVDLDGWQNGWFWFGLVWFGMSF